MKREGKILCLFLLNPVTLFLVFIFFIFPVYIFISGTYLSKNYAKIKNELIKTILNYEEVINAEILYDDDFFELQIDIDLRKGKLLLANVDESLKGNIKIIRIGDYRVFCFNRPYDLFDFELLLGTKLKTVNDIIINYDKLFALIDAWPNLSELKSDTDDSASDTINRVSQLFIPAILDNEIFIFAKMNWDDEWNIYFEHIGN